MTYFKVGQTVRLAQYARTGVVLETGLELHGRPATLVRWDHDGSEAVMLNQSITPQQP